MKLRFHILYFSLLLLVVTSLTSCALLRLLRLGPSRLAAVVERGVEEDTAMLEGAQLAVDEVNAQGGIAGRRLELVTRATAPDSASLNETAADLGRANVAAAFGLSNLATVQTFYPMLRERGIPFVTVGATSPRLIAQFGPTAPFFYASFGDNAQAAAAAEFGLRQFGKNALLVADDRDEYTRLLANYFQQHFSSVGGWVIKQIVFKEKLDQVTHDHSHVDFIYLAALPETALDVVKTLRQAGWKQPIIGGDRLEALDLAAAAEADLGKLYCTTHAFLSKINVDKSIQRFLESYRSRFGHEPKYSAAALGYDIVEVLAGAMAALDPDRQPSLSRALLQVSDFQGLSGTVSYVPGRHLPEKSIFFIRLSKSGPELVEEVYAPEATAP